MLKKVCRIRTDRISSRGSEMCPRRVGGSEFCNVWLVHTRNHNEELIVKVVKHLLRTRKRCDRHCPSLRNDGKALHLYR